MSRQKTALASLFVLCLLLAGVWGYDRWRMRDPVAVRSEMLSHLPADANAAVILDFAQLRSSPFLTQLLAWAPHPAPEEDYAQFVRATGFNYERDLDRVALAVTHQGGQSFMFVIADGCFDRQKIEAYAARTGKVQKDASSPVFTILPGGSARSSYFTFLREGRLAWTDDPSYASTFLRSGSSISAEWRERFDRLAGTPLFALIRQEPGDASALVAKAPGGFRSPQLAALLGQLQWISVGAKPEGKVLRVVVDGECFSESTMRQLSDMLGGILVLAQAGLNDPQTRKKLDPQVREGYLEMLQSADVQKIDRGASKSVRMVFDVTPKMLQAAWTARPQISTPHP